MWLELQRRDVVSLETFTRQDLDELFRCADYIRSLPPSERLDMCAGRTLATIFFQPSTRTRLSLESAILFVGGAYISFGHPDMTKASAGESLEDTVRVLSGYADVLALRHPSDNAAQRAKDAATVPVINAGCGTLEHPTQALVDLYSLYSILGSVDGLTIGLLGDLGTQRAVNSLIMGLSRFDVKLHLISHPSRRLRPETALHMSDVTHSETSTLDHVLPELDVLYIVRIDRERTSGPEHYEELRGGRRVRAADLSHAKPSLVVLNPLPRDDEMDSDVDATVHAQYFRQAHLGRPLRAALMSMMLGG